MHDVNSVFTGIKDEPAIVARVNIYPNPSSGICNVQLSNVEGKTRIELYNLTGRIVYQNENVTGKLFSMDLRGFNAGTYILKATNNNSVITTKLIKE